MKETTRKLIQWGVLGIACLCGILAIVFPLVNDEMKYLSDIQVSWPFDLTYWILVLLIVASIAAIVVFLCVKLADRFKSVPGYAKKFFIILGVAVVVCLVSFLLSKGNDVTPAMMEKFNVTEGVSKLIGAACILVYILVIGSAISIVYAEIAKSLKK